MFTPVRHSFQTAFRAAAVQLLRDFREATGVKLQVNSGRPTQISLPSAFVDRLSETLTLFGPTDQQRTPRAEVVFLHGLFDSPSAADAKDQFVDDFIEWVLTRYHAAGATTLLAIVSTEDDPGYFAEWLQPDQRGPYYATRITLEGTG